MADQDPKGPSKGRPKVEVMQLDAVDWDMPLASLGSAKKRAPSKPSQKRGDGGGSSPAAAAKPPEKPTMVQIVPISDDVFDDWDKPLSRNRGQKAGNKPSEPAPGPRAEAPKPPPKVEVVELRLEDLETVFRGSLRGNREIMNDAKAQSKEPVVGNAGWYTVMEAIRGVMRDPKDTLSRPVVFHESRKRSRGGAGTKSDPDPVSLWLDKCIQGFRAPPKESPYDPRTYFQATKGDGMLAQNVSLTPAQCQGLIADLLRAKSHRLLSASDCKAFFRQIRENPSVGSGFTLVFALTLEPGLGKKTLTKHWRVLACDGDCWTKNEGMKDSRFNSSGPRPHKDVERLVSADGGSYSTPGLFPPVRGVGGCHFLTPVHHLYSRSDVHFLPEHGAHPTHVRSGQSIDGDDFVLGSSVIVTSAVGMDSLQCMKLVNENYSLPIVRSAVTAYSHCVMAKLLRFKQIYPSVDDLKTVEKHQDRDFTWETKFCAFRCRELKRDALHALIKEVDEEVLKILKGDEIKTRDELTDERLEHLVGRLSYWAKVLFRLEKPREGEIVFMSQLSKNYREKVCKEKRAALTNLTPEQQKTIAELTELLVNQNPLPSAYKGNVEQSKKSCISKPAGDDDESGSDIEGSEGESESKESSESSDFDPGDIEESDEEGKERGSQIEEKPAPGGKKPEAREVKKKPAPGGKKPEAREAKKNPALLVKKTVKKPSRPTYSSSLRKNASIRREVAALAQASIHDEDTDDSSAEDISIDQQLKSQTLAAAMANVENTKQYLIENPLDLDQLMVEVPEAWPEGKPEEEVLKSVAQDLATALSLHNIIGAASDKPLICRNETKLSTYNQVACHTQMKQYVDDSRNMGEAQASAMLARYRQGYGHLLQVRKQANLEEDPVILDALCFSACAFELMRPVERALDDAVDARRKKEEANALAGQSTSAAPKPVTYPFFGKLSKFILSLKSGDPLFETVETIAKMRKIPESNVAQFVFRVCKKNVYGDDASEEESSDDEASGEEA